MEEPWWEDSAAWQGFLGEILPLRELQEPARWRRSAAVRNEPGISTVLFATSFKDAGQLILQNFIFPWIKVYFPLNKNVSPVYAELPAKPFHIHPCLNFTLALCGCRAARMIILILLRRKLRMTQRGGVTCPRSQGYKVPEWACQLSSIPSSCLPAARAEVALVLGRRGQISSWQGPPRAV